MPLFYLRRLTGSERTEGANRQLARYLAFVAGAINAGGFLAVHQHTSHMTGVVATLADNVAIGNFSLAVVGLTAVLSFLGGAAFTALMVRWARRHGLQSQYALPLALEAVMLIAFGLEGRVFGGYFVLGTVILLCFTMGLQNAIVTKLSGAVIRTTHVTGMVTDVGIKLGRILDSILSGKPAMAEVEADKLWLLASLIGLFFAGGVTGALGFKHLGFLFALPFAAVLMMLAAVPMTDDLRKRSFSI